MKTSVFIIALALIFVSQAEAERDRGSDDSKGPKLICIYKNAVTLPLEIPLDRQKSLNNQSRAPYRQTTATGEVIQIRSEDYGSDGMATAVTFKFNNKTQVQANLNGSDSIQFESSHDTDLESCSVMGAKQVLQVMLDGPNWRGRSQPPKPEKYYVGGTLLDGGSLRSGRKARMDQQADTVTKYDHLLPEAPAGKPAQSSEAAPDSAE